MKDIEKKYDLIGYRIVSPFHLMALTAFAQNFRPEKKSLNLLVIVSRGPWTENILKSDSVPDPRLKMTFVNEEDAGLIYPLWWPLLLIIRPFVTWFTKWAGVTRIPVCAPTLSCLRFSSRNFSALLHFEPILLDEGIGSFNTLQNFRREARQKFRSKWAQSLALYGFRLVHSSLRLLGGNRIALFRFSNKGPVLNFGVADSYRRVFKMWCGRRGEPVRFGRYVILILTQPFDDIGVCSSEELVNEIKRLIQMIRDRGFEPVLKIHPAEDPAKYQIADVEHVQYDGMAEEIFAAAGDEIVEIWGFSSTSLITGNALYGIRSRRIEMPWADVTIGGFEDEARSLFLAYTETLDGRGAQS